MKRLILALPVLAILAIGCGGPSNSDPKPVNVKEDPRLLRASPGGNTPAPQGQLKKGLKAAE